MVFQHDASRTEANGVKGGTLLKRFLNVYRERGGKRIGMRIEEFAFTTVTRNTGGRGGGGGGYKSRKMCGRKINTVKH